MKFTASQQYLNYANGASKEIRWRIFVRKTESLSASIVGYSNWMEVTSYISEIPSIKSNIEYELGQFKSDSINLTGLVITWWDANIFNATEAEYLELKVEMQLGLNGIYASDIAYMFSGFIDKQNISYYELTDSVAFTVLTAEDIGSRISAEHISTQYLNYDVKRDGTNVLGVSLQKIRGVDVTDVNMSGYPLKIGVHTIVFDNGLKLDDGLKVAILDNNYMILGNGKTTDLDTERVKVYIYSGSELSNTKMTDKIIIKALGGTLPYQFYANISGYRMLELIYNRIGISNLTFDTLLINTFDGRKLVTYLDLPPNDESITGLKWAIGADGTYLYVGIGTKLYRRNMLTNEYMLITTVPTGHNISKIIYNARNNHLWVIYGISPTIYNYKLRRILLADNTFADFTMLADGSISNIELIDFNYSGDLWKYGIIYAALNAATRGIVKFVDGITMIQTTVIEGTTLGLPGTNYILNRFAFMPTTNNYWFTILSTGSYYRLHRIYIDPAGDWVNLLSGSIIPTDYEIAAYNPFDGKIYFHDYVAAKIKYHNYDNDLADVTLKTEVYYGAGFIYDSITNNVYCTAFDYVAKSDIFYSMKNGILTEADKIDVYRTEGLYSTIRLGDIIYGIDLDGRLFQYGNKISFFIYNADFEGKTITDALHETLLAFNLIPNISFMKKAYVYRRGNDSGVPQTTGNNIKINISNTNDLKKDTIKYSKAAFVTLSNGIVTTSYNGNSFDAGFLSNQKQISISNGLIPTKIIKDLLYYYYQFYKTSRDLFETSIGEVPLFQYEPFDGGALNFTTTKIQSSITGVVYGIEYQQDGTMNIEVLV